MTAYFSKIGIRERVFILAVEKKYFFIPQEIQSKKYKTLRGPT
jgi:hypothetical protein